MQAEKMLNLRLPLELASQLEALMQATGRTESALAVEALQGYVAAETWQMADIQAGVEEADRGDFATDAEVTAFFAKNGC